MKQLQDISHSMTISVVMPVYNVAPYVERCLLSVMQQTRPAEECLIIDDASTDNSIALCERLMANYDGPTRFTILHHDHNRGLSAARNTGTDAATGAYIYYLDSDDEMTADCLERLSAPVEHDDSIEMVKGNLYRDTSAMNGWRHQLRRKLGTPQPRFMQGTPLELRSNEEIRDWFYRGKVPCPLAVWNKLLKLSFVKEHQLYNKEGRLYEDTLWTYYLIRCLSHVAFVHEVTYIYYRRPGSICTGTQNDERLRHFGYNYREIAENIVPGERLGETMYWHKYFYPYYIDAHDNPDFQFAYNAFRREISSALHRSHLSPGQAPVIGSAGQLGSYSAGQLRSALWLLTTVHYLSKSRVGRFLFKTALRARLLLQRIVHALQSITYHRARPQ